MNIVAESTPTPPAGALPAGNGHAEQNSPANPIPPPSPAPSPGTQHPPLTAAEQSQIPLPRDGPDPATLAAIAAHPKYRILRLPPDVVEAIHQMLYRHIPYNDLLAALGDYGKVLNKANLSRFKKSPAHQAWLRDQQRRDDTRAQLQVILDLAKNTENGAIHEAIQRTTALRICEAVADLDPAALKQTLQQDPKTLVQLVQVLPKLSQSGMDCEHLRLQLAERKVKLENDKIPPSERGVSDEALAEAERKLRLR